MSQVDKAVIGNVNVGVSQIIRVNIFFTLTAKNAIEELGINGTRARNVFVKTKTAVLFKMLGSQFDVISSP